MVRTADCTGGVESPATAPSSMYSGSVSSTRASVVIEAAQIARVRVSTRRMPHTPIQRLVSGPATACPTEVAASTSPAAPYEPVTCSMCSRIARLVIPLGKRAVSWAAMMRPTPGVRRRSR